MKLKLISFFLFASIAFANAQKAYLVNDFMKGYTLLFVTQTTGTKIKQYYKLTENESKKMVLEFGLKELSKPTILKTAKITAFKNISESHIHILGDANFDGRQDICIYETEAYDEGCYTPQATAHVFINLPTSFVESPSISDVYNSANCMRGGSFDIDTKNKRLITWSLGGAALHGCSQYSVSGIKAKEECYFEEDGFGASPFSQITGKKLENNKWVPFTSLSLYEEGLEEDKLLAFDTKNGKGRIILFKVNNVLYYAFQQNDQYKFISFAHPSSPEKASKATFKFRKQNSTSELEFNSGSIKYIIYETTNAFGIRIYVNGKLSDWQGTAKQGSLAKLTNSKFLNILKE
ncbi:MULTISPECIES: XAC2610-related protein [Flavobacterium]|uniref:XAC2610-related protein n=1 Tax=Flavobacterium TaxID=237 RepID=UPI001181E3A5|nr:MULTISPECIES: hypothetical protein [Flavobacterium]MCR4033083.1 hypothetical protein [Flavobacterium panacis]